MTDVVIAIDIGGTGMKCALVDAADGTIRHTERHLTGAERGPAAVVDTIVEVAAGLADTARLEGLEPLAIGLVAPGVIDEANGVAVWSANVGFRDVPLRDLVTARLELPAALGHDVRAGAFAEARSVPGGGPSGSGSSPSAPASPPRTCATAAPTPARTAHPARSGTSSCARTARGAAAAAWLPRGDRLRVVGRAAVCAAHRYEDLRAPTSSRGPPPATPPPPRSGPRRSTRSPTACASASRCTTRT